MNRKIIVILFLLVFLACSIGTVFADDINLDNGNLNEEDSTQITEKIDGESSDNQERIDKTKDSTQIIEKIDEANSNSQEETDKTEDSNKNEEPIQKSDDDEDEYFNVTFVYEETVVKKVKSGEKVIPPKIQVGPNDNVYWIDEDGEIFDFDIPITRNITLTLELTVNKVDPPICYIYFHTNGGSGVINYLSLRLGNAISSPLPKTTKAGHKFLGWYDEDGKEWKTGMIPEGTMDLYAKWEKKPTTVESPKTTTAPKTGDNNNTLMYIGMMILSGTGIFMGLKRIKKEKV